MVDINDLFRQAAMQQQPMSGMGQYQSDSYTPTSGAQMEADSRSSADSAIDRLLSMQERNHQNDRNMQWMSFFGKLASSKSPTFLGGLGDAAGALSETAGKQQQNNQLLEQTALSDKLKYEEWKREQTRQEAAQKSTEAAQQATAAYQRGELGTRNAALAIQRQQLEQGKISTNPVTGQLYYNSGEKMGQAVPNQENGSNAKLVADSIGVPLVPYTSREDSKQSAKLIAASGDNIGASNDAIMSIQRIQELLPKIDQGLMARAEREGVKALGEGTPERAAYEEIQKLEGNAALQNEVANGVRGRALGFNMVKLGQGLFASPEMDKDAQAHILGKALFTAQMAKNANEVIQPLEGHSTGTLNAAKQKYYNDSIAAGKAIPTQDYLSGAWKSNTKKPLPTPDSGGWKIEEIK